jgi:hypothetical protein
MRTPKGDGRKAVPVNPVFARCNYPQEVAYKWTDTNSVPMKNSILFFCCLVLTGARLTGQGSAGGSVRLSGKVTELSMIDSAERTMSGASIEVWSRGEKLMTVPTGVKGRYQCNLPFFNTYQIKYLAPEFVTKMVDIDATDFARETRERGFNIEVDMTLFRKEAGCVEFDFLSETPVAKARYNKKENTVVWDQDHIERMNGKIRNAMATCRK